jgi:hypothetical protein
MNVVVDYMGNLNPISGNSLDSFVSKATELECPAVLLPLFENHRELMYYPAPSLITDIVKYYNQNNKWDELKTFFNKINQKR